MEQAVKELIESGCTRNLLTSKACMFIIGVSILNLICLIMILATPLRFDPFTGTEGKQLAAEIHKLHEEIAALK